ncbi:hypothetical protein, partial [Glutamicibacter sp.]|uniref:hypothetical protein n=1 Tax=Glutamicibacter sp. TaxID=1931995 RepID=UPI003D6BA963
YSPNKNIRYQQTWHTIEFSNNKHSRHHNDRFRRSLLRSGATLQAYHQVDRCQLDFSVSFTPPFPFRPFRLSGSAARDKTLHGFVQDAKSASEPNFNP